MPSLPTINTVSLWWPHSNPGPTTLSAAQNSFCGQIITNNLWRAIVGGRLLPRLRMALIHHHLTQVRLAGDDVEEKTKGQSTGKEIKFVDDYYD